MRFNHARARVARRQTVVVPSLRRFVAIAAPRALRDGEPFFRPQARSVCFNFLRISMQSGRR